jgi:two-component system, LytTR family, response regulator
MHRHNVIIIDDERNVREGLSALIVKYCPEILICGSVSTASEGRELLKSHRVDIIFLDISMPNEDGFMFLDSIPKEQYGIIFTTAFHEYALRALKANAIDYLLKPINPEELLEAVNKAINHLALRNNNMNVQEV